MEEIENFYDFIQWCFRNTISTIITIIILGSLGTFIIETIKALKGKKD